MASVFSEPQLTERFFGMVGLDLLIAAFFQCIGLGLLGLSENVGFLYVLIFGSILYMPMIVFYDVLVLGVTIIPMIFIWRHLMRYLSRRGYCARSATMITAPTLAAFHTVVFYFAVGWMMGGWSSMVWDKLNLLGLLGAVTAVLVLPFVVHRRYRNEATGVGL